VDNRTGWGGNSAYLHLHTPRGADIGRNVNDVARAHPEIEGLVDWQPLARGGFSTVWRARQESLDRLVAVKVDHRTLEDDKEQRRFLREAGAAGRLSGHPGIVTVHYAGILPDDRPYLVMDFCPGGSLTRWLKPQNRASEQRILDVGIRIADALAAAHARGVLHRDVKPANILIDSYDNPGLADFGLAALPEPGIDLSVTLEGMTPAYAPKEVFYLKPPTEYGDVYSLAATLYALFDGKPPRWPDSGTASLPELLEMQKHPVQRLPHVNDAFMDVLMGALNDEPEERPTAAQFRDQLGVVDLGAASPTSSAAALVTAPAPLVATGLPAADTDSEDAEPALPVPSGLAASTDPTGPDSAAGSTPDGLTDAPARRRWGRRSIALVAVAAGVAAALVAVMLLDPGPSRGTVQPPASQSATPSSDSSETSEGSTPSAAASSAATTSTTKTPKATPPPHGFVDCSAKLGKTSYCITDPECWTEIISLYDQPKVGIMQDCNANHNYQTFAAGPMPDPIMRQSQLTARKDVKQLCSAKTLNRVLSSRRALKDWEIFPLPPQLLIKTDNVYRCLFGFGPRSKPVKLNVPK
jgi:serine/threonine protein kinase